MRIRKIKPEFFADEELAALPPLARLLFIGCWCIADKNGVLEDRPQQIKAWALPHDSPDMSQLLHGLLSGGWLVRFRGSNGKSYLFIRNFKRHQSISGKESQAPAKWPLPPEEVLASGKCPAPSQDGSGIPGQWSNGVMESGGEGTSPLSPSDSEIPTEAEVRAWADLAAVHPDYAADKWASTTEQHLWVVGGKLIDWRRRWLRFWMKDRDSWLARRKKNGAPIAAVDSPAEEIEALQATLEVGRIRENGAWRDLSEPEKEKLKEQLQALRRKNP